MTRYNTESFESFFDWHESTFDDAKAIGELLGWQIDDIYYSGFWSQGDGACFTGTLRYAKGCVKAVKSYAPLDTELHAIAAAWQALQREHGYKFTADIVRGHGANFYSHENTVTIQVDCYAPDSHYDSEETALDIARDFMRWIYKRLESEYEYQRAWNAAQQWSDCLDEAQEARSAARDALRDYRATMASKCAPTLPDSVKSAAKRAIRSALQEYADALELRAAIADEFHYWQDGKAMDIAEFAEGNL